MARNNSPIFIQMTVNLMERLFCWGLSGAETARIVCVFIPSFSFWASGEIRWIKMSFPGNWRRLLPETYFLIHPSIIIWKQYALVSYLRTDSGTGCIKGWRLGTIKYRKQCPRPDNKTGVGIWFHQGWTSGWMSTRSHQQQASKLSGSPGSLRGEGGEAISIFIRWDWPHIWGTIWYNLFVG